MAGSPFDDLVARVEREYAIVNSARRLSEGFATAGASFNWLENIQRTINPGLMLHDQLITAYGAASHTVGESYTELFDCAHIAPTGIFPELQRYPEPALGRSIGESYAGLFDYAHIATGISSELQRYNELALGRSIGESYAGLFDYGHTATGIFLELQRWNELLRSVTANFSDDLFVDLELHLIEEGWYLSIDLPAGVVLDAADLHDEQKSEAIETTLRNLFRQRTGEVERLAVSAFPHRRRFIEAAFRAHRAKEYGLSIPVLLTQIDGVSGELWQENFFRPARSNRQIDKILERRDSGLSATVLRHLYEQGSLRASFKPGSKPTRLNRHAVIHGTSTDYDPRRTACDASLCLSS